MYGIKLNKYKECGFDVDKALIDITANIIKGTINKNRKENKRRNFNFRNIKLNNIINLSYIDDEVYESFKNYLSNSKISIGNKLSYDINKYCHIAAMNTIFNHMDIFIDLDTSLDFAIEIYKQTMTDSNIKKNFTIMQHWLAKGFKGYKFNSDVTIREMFSIIEKKSGYDVLRISHIRYYKLYEIMVDDMFPYLGFKGYDQKNIIYLTYVLKKLSYVISDKVICELAAEKQVYKIRKGVILEPCKYNYLEGKYDLESFKKIKDSIK